jgi:hypothetical protein
MSLGESPIRPDSDIHAVCDLVKSWFRVMPEPVFPAESYYEIMQKMRRCRLLLGDVLPIADLHILELEDLEERLAAIRSVVQRLPQANFDILRRVSEHLDKFVILCVLT